MQSKYERPCGRVIQAGGLQKYESQDRNIEAMQSGKVLHPDDSNTSTVSSEQPIIVENIILRDKNVPNCHTNHAKTRYVNNGGGKIFDFPPSRDGICRGGMISETGNSTPDVRRNAHGFTLAHLNAANKMNKVKLAQSRQSKKPEEEEIPAREPTQVSTVEQGNYTANNHAVSDTSSFKVFHRPKRTGAILKPRNAQRMSSTFYVCNPEDFDDDPRVTDTQSDDSSEGDADSQSQPLKCKTETAMIEYNCHEAVQVVERCWAQIEEQLKQDERKRIVDDTVRSKSVTNKVRKQNCIVSHTFILLFTLVYNTIVLHPIINTRLLTLVYNNKLLILLPLIMSLHKLQTGCASALSVEVFD